MCYPVLAPLGSDTESISLIVHFKAISVALSAHASADFPLHLHADTHTHTHTTELVTNAYVEVVANDSGKAVISCYPADNISVV